jgi:universal stress protein E
MSEKIRRLTIGEVSTQMTRIAKKTHARIIVMGAISRGALKRLFIGSTAERVLDDATYDILVVKSLAATAQSSRRRAPARLQAA